MPPRSAAKRHLLRRGILILTPSLALFLTLALGAYAQPQVPMQSKYLEALRERGWYDTALEYLNEYAEKDPLMTDQFRRLLSYEKGRTCAEQAKHATNSQQRIAEQKQAIAHFLEFSQANPKLPETLDALHQASNLIASAALQSIAKLQKLPELASSEREQLRNTTGQLLDRGIVAAQNLKDLCDEQLQGLPKPAVALRDPKIAKRRDLLRARQAEARFLLAKATFDKAQVLEEGSAIFNQTLEKATDFFANLAKDHSNNLTGFYGRLYEGRCYQKLGNVQEALARYEDLVDQPIQNALFRQLVARAYRRRAECFLLEEKFDSAIEECQHWLDMSRKDELGRREWLAVKYLLAQAMLKKSEALPKPDAKLTSDMRRLLTEVSQNTGEFQNPARVALAALGGKSPEDHPSGQQPVDVLKYKKYATAFAAGKDAMERMNSSKLAARLAKKNNPEAVESLQSRANHARIEARLLMERALELASNKSSNEPLESVRYYLCWLNWEEGRLHEAAILGSFLARNYPESPYAPVAAQVALAAYERLYNQALAGSNPEAENSNLTTDVRYAGEQLSQLAQLVVSRWPDSSESAAASQILVQLAVRNGNLEDAEALLERLPETSRAAGQVQLGSALWKSYLKTKPTSSDRADPQAMEKCGRARELLRQGLKGVDSLEQITPGQAQGALALAQLELNLGDAQASIQVLEDPRIGPLTLLHNEYRQEGANDEKHGFPQQDFSENTYKTALRAYVTVLPPQRKQAMAMMDALEKIVAQGGDAANGRQLTRIYVSLGLQLQKQVDLLTTSGQDEEAGRVAKAFEDFLERVGERADVGDWSVRIWIAQTNQQLGIGLRAGKNSSDNPSPDTALQYFEKAKQAYVSLLEHAAKNPDFAPSPMALLGVRKRLSDCHKQLGEYEDAMQGYADILQQQPNLLELQRAAATTLQDWGSHERRLELMDRAIRGSRKQKNGKNLIWGWLRLAQIADYFLGKARTTLISDNEQSSQPSTDEQKNAARQKIAKYQSLFFEAKYHAIEARFQGACFSQGPTKQKHLRTAQKSMQSMFQLYPDFGEGPWKERFEQLRAEIQTEVQKKNP